MISKTIATTAILSGGIGATVSGSIVYSQRPVKTIRISVPENVLDAFKEGKKMCKFRTLVVEEFSKVGSHLLTDWERRSTDSIGAKLKAECEMESEQVIMLYEKEPAFKTTMDKVYAEFIKEVKEE